MSLSVNQVIFLRDMTIKYKDSATRKRLKRRMIDKSEFNYLIKMYKEMEKSHRVLNVMRFN